MELASMLAGEPFSDRPRSVSPAIAAFLRAYNDAIDDTRRQQLYEVAAMVIGTRSTPEIEQRRIELWQQWGRRHYQQRGPLARLRWRLRYGHREPLDCDVAAFLAVASVRRHTDATHAEVLELVRTMCRMGQRDGYDGAHDIANVSGLTSTDPSTAGTA
jgi:hypothetical protein